MSHRRKHRRPVPHYTGPANPLDIFNKGGGRCWYCGKTLIQATRSDALLDQALKWDVFTVDHFIPRAKGGSEAPQNKVPACFWCNHNKMNYDLEDFRNVLAYKKAGYPKFTLPQRDFLTANGLKLPIAEYTFYFEKMGL